MSDGTASNSSGDSVARVADLLHEAAETHHVVYRIVDGDDPDWATWYSNWLVDLSELPQILGTTPVRSELTYHLVRLEREFTREPSGGTWEEHYARGLVAEFGSGGGGDSGGQRLG